MTVKDIYDSALRLLGEPADNGSDSDYADRAPYIVAAFCCDAAQADRDFRETHALSAQPSFSEVFLDLSAEFPLSPRFASAAAYYLAAMLIFEEDESRSDSLFAKYCDSLSAAITEIPARLGKIKNMYR